MNLLYSYAYGDPIYKQLCQEMVSSARANGFKGEVIILTDAPHEFEGARNIVLELGKRELWRTAIRNVLSIEAYEKIAYIDSDIIFTKNPEYLMGFEKIAISSAGNPLTGAIVASHFLRESEKRYAAENKLKGINSGTVVFPGKGAYEFLANWEARWQSFDFDNAPYVLGKPYKEELWDECALQSLCIRGEIEWEFIPSEMVLFPNMQFLNAAPFSKETVCIHFVGSSHLDGGKEKNLEWAIACRNPLAIPVLVQKIKAEIQARRTAVPDHLKPFVDQLGVIMREFPAMKKRLEELEKWRVENEILV